MIHLWQDLEVAGKVDSSEKGSFIQVILFALKSDQKSMV